MKLLVIAMCVLATAAAAGSGKCKGKDLPRWRCASFYCKSDESTNRACQETCDSCPAGDHPVGCKDAPVMKQLSYLFFNCALQVQLLGPRDFQKQCASREYWRRMCPVTCGVCGVGIDCYKATGDLRFVYEGTTSKTKNNRDCQAWNKKSPHKPSRKPKKDANYPWGSRDDNSNYCRNPSDWSGGLWCYTMDKAKRWEECAIPSCGDAKTKAHIKHLDDIYGNPAIKGSQEQSSIFKGDVGTTVERCFDVDGANCDAKKCQTDEVTKRYCLKTCNSCPTVDNPVECKDASEDVQREYLIPYGNCTAHADWCETRESTRRLCPVTCKVCYDESCLADGKGYIGNEIETLSDVTSPGDCHIKCQEKDGCVVWTYDSDRRNRVYPNRPAKPSCKLQSAKGTEWSKQYEISSGPKTCKEIGYRGGPIYRG